LDRSNILKKADELNELAEKFTLSHAVLATAKKIEDDKLSPKNGSKGTLDKAYISVANLSCNINGSVNGARTFYYKREVNPETQFGGPSYSEHFDIILPAKPSNADVLIFDNGKISKKSERFLVGHELGHLWLHLEDVRKTINKTDGTKSLPVELEPEANTFSFELSELRDKRLLDRIACIVKNKPHMKKELLDILKKF